MREIKFRAWDRKQKRMWDMGALLEPVNYEELSTLDKLLGDDDGIWGFFDDSDEYKGTHTDYCKEDFELMQYTGLKDENGKEIYEGDILQSEVEGYEGDYPGSIITVESVIRYGNIRFELEVSEYKMVVIGNIYENPELLKLK